MALLSIIIQGPNHFLGPTHPGIISHHISDLGTRKCPLLELAMYCHTKIVGGPRRIRYGVPGRAGR